MADASRRGDQLNNTDKLTPVTQRILSALKGETINYADWSIAQQFVFAQLREMLSASWPGREI